MQRGTRQTVPNRVGSTEALRPKGVLKGVYSMNRTLGAIAALAIICALSVPAAHAQANSTAITGVYKGEYRCAHGPVNLQLSLAALGNGLLAGVFTFDLPSSDSPHTASYSLRGTYDPSTGKFRLNPDQWTSAAPAGYVMVGMEGTFNSDDDKVSGKITYGKCTTFEAARNKPKTATAAAKTPATHSAPDKSVQTLPPPPARPANETSAHASANPPKPVASAPAEPQPSTNTRGVTPAQPPKSAPPEGKGQSVALVIGINDYKHLPKLKTAVGDANAIAKVLHDSYGFDVRVLHNSTRNEIMKALSEYRRTLDEHASFLVYYAGHGYYDKEADKAYWLPVDADQENTSNWIIADEITTDIKVIPAAHILIISDSCYSGGITRGFSPTFSPTERGRYLRKMIDGKSRTLMSSGGLEPVSDSGSDGHSVFAGALLNGLKTNDEPAVSAEILFQDFVRVSVAGKSEQTPQYGAIRNSGHDAGDFVFFKKRE